MPHYAGDACPGCVRRAARIRALSGGAVSPEQSGGVLVERSGRFGAFLGCSLYGSGGCRHTEQLPRHPPGRPHSTPTRGAGAELLSDEALLSVDVDGLAAAATPLGWAAATPPAAAARSAPAKPKIPAELSDDALLAVDLDGLVAAASPPATAAAAPAAPAVPNTPVRRSTPPPLTPDQTKRIAENRARAEARRAEARKRKLNWDGFSSALGGSSAASSAAAPQSSMSQGSSVDSQDEDDPDGSIAALFAAEKRGGSAPAPAKRARPAEAEAATQDEASDADL